VLARVFFFIESVDLNPRGPHSTQKSLGSGSSYQFQSFPKFEDFDESKGITFEMGKIGDTTIDKVVIL